VVAAWGVGLVIGPALGGYLAQVIFFFFFVSSLEKAMDFVHGHKVTCFERHDFNSSFENADAWNSICTYNQILYLLDGFILWNFYYSRCWNTHIYFQRVPFGIGMLIFVVF